MSRATPATISAMTPIDDQPSSLPRTIAWTRASTPAAASRAPTTSMRARAPKSLFSDEEREGDRDDRDGDVDPEDRLPVPALHDRAADEGADRDAEAGDAAPEADRERSPLGRHAAGDERERQRHDAPRRRSPAARGPR